MLDLYVKTHVSANDEETRSQTSPRVQASSFAIMFHLQLIIKLLFLTFPSVYLSPYKHFSPSSFYVLSIANFVIPALEH